MWCGKASNATTPHACSLVNPPHDGSMNEETSHFGSLASPLPSLWMTEAEDRRCQCKYQAHIETLFSRRDQTRSPPIFKTVDREFVK